MTPVLPDWFWDSEQPEPAKPTPDPSVCPDCLGFGCDVTMKGNCPTCKGMGTTKFVQIHVTQPLNTRKLTVRWSQDLALDYKNLYGDKRGL